MTEKPQQSGAEPPERDTLPPEPDKDTAPKRRKLSRATQGWFLLLILLLGILFFGGREEPDEALVLSGPDDLGFYRLASVRRSGDGFLQIPMPDFAGADAPVREPLTPEQIRSGLFSDPALPVLGPAGGDFVLVEFFDFRCPYCKVIAPIIADLVADDDELKHVIVDWPLLGPESEYAARAALAAGRQGAYKRFREALMDTSGEPGEALVVSVAESLGLDVARLRRDMASDEIAQRVEANNRLAESLRLRGSPVFVFGDAIVEGAISRARLESLIAEQKARQTAAGADGQ